MNTKKRIEEKSRNSTVATVSVLSDPTPPFSVNSYTVKILSQFIDYDFAKRILTPSGLNPSPY